MSRYIYTFIKNGTEETEVVSCNLPTACEVYGIVPTRMDRHSNHYLATTPFNERERYVWVGTTAYKVKQRKNDYLK